MPPKKVNEAGHKSVETEASGNHAQFLHASQKESSACGSTKRPDVNTLFEFINLDEKEFDNPRYRLTGHHRLYHHMTTRLPIYPKEVVIDSEDETDPGWLQKKMMMMIDEFIDVNEGEKEIMKMWNLHVMKHRFVADFQMPLACLMFVEEHGKELLRKNLYRNFVLHLTSLIDFGLISPVELFDTVKKLQDIIQSDEAIEKQLQESWQAQRENWNPVSQQPQNVETLEKGRSSGLGMSLTDSVERRKSTAHDKKPLAASPIGVSSSSAGSDSGRGSSSAASKKANDPTSNGNGSCNESSATCDKKARHLRRRLRLSALATSTSSLSSSSDDNNNKAELRRKIARKFPENHVKLLEINKKGIDLKSRNNLTYLF